jgi:hypothetical protein
MVLLYALGIFAVLWINIAALTLLLQRWLPGPALARASGIVGICSLLFAVEHLVGLGDP